MRIRQNFEAERTRCLEDRAHFIKGYFINDKDKGNACQLPEDCSHCERFVCTACERVVGWDFGSDDDARGLCDDCWVMYAKDWTELEELLEKRRMDAYEQACVL